VIVFVFNFSEAENSVFSQQRSDTEAVLVLGVRSASLPGSRTRLGHFVLMCCLLLRVIY
jgi:hypothetical protein